MAPKHQRNPQGIVNTDKPVTTATEDTAITWTGRPLDEPTWYYANKKTLFDEVEGAREFIQYGIVISEKSGNISASSLAHVQAYLNGTIVAGTLSAPFDPASLPALVAVSVAASAPTTAGAPTPPPILVMPSKVEQLGPDADRFKINRELVARKSESILRHFTDRITNQSLRIATVEAVNYSGRQFIVNMEAKMNRADSVKNTAASARKALLDAHRRAGLSANTTEAWTTFINEDTRHNEALQGTAVYSDQAALAHAYDMLLLEHSTDIHTKVILPQ